MRCVFLSRFQKYAVVHFGVVVSLLDADPDLAECPDTEQRFGFCTGVDA